MLDQRQDDLGASRVLELGHAVGRGGRYDSFGIDQQLDQRTRGLRPVELAKRHRDLLAHAGIGIGDHFGEMADRGGIAGMAERDDRDAALPWIGALEPLVGIFEIVVGFERARHDYLRRYGMLTVTAPVGQSASQGMQYQHSS